MATLLAIFLIVEALAPGSFEAAADLPDSDPLAAAVGVSLLVGDVILPVPSSIVMLAQGARFGVPLGTLLSTVGLVGGGIAGYLAGRMARRVVPVAGFEQADRWLDRWGLAAIVASRPVPVLAETVSILAGASRLPPGRVALATAAGALPIAFVYALLGAAVAGSAARPAAFAACLGLSILALRASRS